MHTEPSEEEFLISEAVFHYWQKHYKNPHFGVCILCANTGHLQAVEQKGAQLRMEGKTFCICPNGQLARTDAELEEKTKATLEAIKLIDGPPLMSAVELVEKLKAQLVIENGIPFTIGVHCSE